MGRLGFSQCSLFSATDGGKYEALELICFPSRQGCGQLKMFPMTFGKSIRRSTMLALMSANDCCHEINRENPLFNRTEAFGYDRSFP